MRFAVDCERCLLKPWRDVVCCVLFIKTGSHFDNKKYVLRRLRTSPPSVFAFDCEWCLLKPWCDVVHRVLSITTGSNNYVSSPLYVHLLLIVNGVC